MKKIVLSLFCVIVLISPTSAQKMTAEKILQEIKTRFDAVKDYSAELEAKINLERLHIPQIKIKFYFKQPNKTHIESKNFAMLPKEGLGLNPTDLLEKYDATLINTEHHNDTTYYTLRLLSKPEKNKPRRESNITVDGVRWVVTHIESSPTEGRTISGDIEYVLVERTYLLPTVMKWNFNSPSSSDSTSGNKMNVRRMLGKGSVEIYYSNYEVNKGLPDALFEKKESKK